MRLLLLSLSLIGFAANVARCQSNKLLLLPNRSALPPCAEDAVPVPVPIPFDPSKEVIMGVENNNNHNENRDHQQHQHQHTFDGY